MRKKGKDGFLLGELLPNLSLSQKLTPECLFHSNNPKKYIFLLGELLPKISLSPKINPTNARDARPTLPVAVWSNSPVQTFQQNNPATKVEDQEAFRKFNSKL